MTDDETGVGPGTPDETDDGTGPTGATGGGTDGRLTPGEAFSVVADETRIDILRALAATEREASARNPVSFSSLFDRVATDDSGLFNYHLKKLTGRFVRKTDEGYQLRYAGRKVVRAVVEGALTDRADLDPFEARDPCPACGAPVEIGYDDRERVAIECTECDETGLYAPFPPNGLAGRSPVEIERTVDRHVRAKFALLDAGVCPECRGEMDAELTGDSPDHWEYQGHEVLAHYRCRSCENQFWTTLGVSLLDHAAVVAFFYERGVDVRDRPFWSHRFVVNNDRLTVESRDPWRVRACVECDGDELRLLVGERLDVLEVEFRRGAEEREAGTV
ncbi:MULTISPECIES: winged helix-turn-helix domain-containing protein [Halorussus]|uniref:winged helix-turn-helix domain-containing protein n=1 Tax=Halorussus TaxID=1070314 RepID=UPI00209CCA60|nr:helix-turn-helix domain-containing protein [Halorussus vallis]USZ77911.1 helix-turn-helix domain-containing protein [Halorussus vallis]